LIVRGPGIAPGTGQDQIALNLDLAPTFAALAGVTPPDFVDGRSLVPLLRGEAPAEWRQGFLAERFAEVRSNRLGTPRPGSVARLDTEGGEPEEEEGVPGVSPVEAPPYLALRTTRYLYVEYGNGERELYDLEFDPFQLQNLAASADPALLARLSAELSQLSHCQEETCRSLEDALLVHETGDSADSIADHFARSLVLERRAKGLSS
jgi:arylsulfatase A-like enzyme